LKLPDVSEVRTASIIRAMNDGILLSYLAMHCNIIFFCTTICNKKNGKT